MRAHACILLLLLLIEAELDGTRTKLPRIGGHR